MKKLVSLLVVALLAMMVTPVLADGHQTITEIVVASSAGEPAEFEILEAALIKAELTGALAGEGPFTVFAPTDQAFDDLLEALEITADQLLDHPQLADVLLYHVVGAKATSGDLADGDTFETLQGEEITIAINGGVFVNESEVIDVDTEASNGVIHVIDKVLVPAAFVLAAEEEMEDEEETEEPMQTIVEIAIGNENFSILVAALQKADLVGALSGEGPFTVFAPTNDAFADLLEALDITAEQLLNQPDLAKVLLYHVISGKVMSNDLEDGMEAATLNGQTVMFDLMSEPAKVNDAGITTVDLEATNGVIHVIDSVLVPDDFELQLDEEEAEEEVPETGRNSALPAAAAMLILGLGALSLGKVLSKEKAE